MTAAHWRETPLRYISIEWCDGPFGSALASEHYRESGARVVRLQNIREAQFAGADEAYVDEEYFTSSLMRHNVVPGDVLVAGLGDDNNFVGRACIAPDGLGRALVKADCFRFRLDRTKATPRFVAYALSATAARAAGELSGGATRQRINLGNMASRKLFLPSLSEQERIANFLDEQSTRIDALIAEKERLLASLDAAAYELLHHSVTKGLRPCTLKSSGRGWIGEIPEHWSAPYIRFVAKLESGHTPSRQVPEYWQNCTIPWFGLSDVWQIRDGTREVVTETSERISELGLANSAARLLPAGTVMLSRTASVGFSAIMGVPMATTQDFANWVCGPRVDPEYLLYVLRSMREEFSALKFGSTHSTIYMPDLARLSTPLPPFDEQREIVKFARARKARLDELRSVAEAAAMRLREYRSSLISAAVTGQLHFDDITTWCEKRLAA